NKIDWQKIAATLAAFNSFAVISGGPGTGKTTTIIRLMALMIEYALKSNRKTFDIALAAPTGKAASRLTEAIQTAYHQLPCDEKVKDMIPKKVMTLHHLLGANPEKSTYRYHQNNLLPVDTLIIDEASMIDMTLMSHLILALDSKTQLILLGDHHQLASVEAGNLLGDLCCFAKQIYSKEHTDRLVTLTGEQTLRQEKIAFGSKLNNHFAMLTKSYRFDHGSAIGQLAQLICNGSHEKLTNLLQQKKTNVAFYDQKTVQTDTLDQLIISGYRPYLEAIQQQADPETIHTLFQQYQVLCAIHDSPFGVQQLNQYIMTVLHKNKLIADIHSNWFIGKPIMITQNYPPLSLYNGDLGITMLDHQGHIRIAFINAQRQIRFILPTRLPEYDIAFAITIHKSQGSEFNQVTIILPDQLNLVMTRELLYTAVTRAKSQLHILGCQSILKDMIKRKTNRYSGLVQRLSTS
ncbi:MAG: exodeoxyribonuclease V subunit alpha, partial [Endozoicomonadaceae bacterium]|nr:exodeoxyribonuclease V subunit alpha [Endozoicomonadaceae bacterium]